jgi:integrase
LNNLIREYVVPFSDEQKYLLKADSISRLLADVVTVLIDSAMRPEECHRLRWEYVSWDGGLHGVFQVVRGKTDTRRELPMSRRVRAILKSRWEHASGPTEGWVFPAPTKSGHMEPSTIKKAHAKALKESKVKRFIPYDLRHTSLTRLACECREPWTVARIAGHGGIKIGQQYVHSHRMERSAWWAEWWAYVNEGRKSGQNVATPVATGQSRKSATTIQ